MARRVRVCALGQLTRRLCSTGGLDSSYDFHGSHLWEPNFAGLEGIFELVCIFDAAEFESGVLLDVQRERARAVADRHREPDTFAIVGADVAARGRLLHTDPIHLP